MRDHDFVTGNPIDKLNPITSIQTMKLTLTLALGIGISLAAHAQETPGQIDTHPTEIIGGVSDGKPSPPSPPKVLPEYKIHWQVVHQKKDHKVIINKVQAPVKIVQQPIEPLSQEEIDRRHEEVMKWLREVKESGGFFTVSATIYDHKATYVRWWNGREEFAAWSNVDWNHLGGFHEFEGRGKRFNMMLFSGNTTMASVREEMNKGYRNTLPEIPVLPQLSERGASYMVVKGNEKNDEAMEFIEAIHDLYDEHSPALVKAWQERGKNYLVYLKKQEELRLNPPPKKDVIINYWEIKPSKKDQSKTK